MEEEEMTPTDILLAVVARAMEAKYGICEENKGITDAPPTLVGELPSGDGFIMPDLMEGHPTDTLPLMLSGLAEGMVDNFQSVRWKWLAYIVEGYAKPAGSVTEEELENHDRGAYEEEYKTNPSTDVREGIIVSVYPWDGEPIGATVFYRYDDNGLPVYDEPDIADGELHGVVSDIFRAFTKACHAYQNSQN